MLIMTAIDRLLLRNRHIMPLDKSAQLDLGGKNIFVAVASLRPRNSDVSTWRLSLYVLWKLPPKFNGYAGSYRYFQTKRKYV